MDPPLLPSLPPLHGAAKDRVTNACKVFCSVWWILPGMLLWLLNFIHCPLPLPSLPPPPAHQGILMDQSVIESSFCYEKIQCWQAVLGTFFFLFLIVIFLHSFSHTLVKKKSHRLEISAVEFKFRKDIWNFHLWPHSKLNICLCLSYYFSPALLTIVVDNLTLRR